MNISHVLDVAQLTKKKTLELILDLDTGEHIDSDKFIKREVRQVIQDRNTMRSRYRTSPENPWLVCSLCGAACQTACNTFQIRGGNSVQ